MASPRPGGNPASLLGKSWVVALKENLWNVAWNLWNHQNDIQQDEIEKSKPWRSSSLTGRVGPLFNTFLPYSSYYNCPRV
jgi:hypothetical protein